MGLPPVAGSPLVAHGGHGPEGGIGQLGIWGGVVAPPVAQGGQGPDSGMMQSWAWVSGWAWRNAKLKRANRSNLGFIAGIVREGRELREGFFSFILLFGWYNVGR